MKLSNLFAVNAVIAAVFGLAFLIAPGPLTELYGVEPLHDAGLYIARLLGAAFLTFAVVTWRSRFAEDSTARQAVVLALLVGFVVGFVVTLIAQLSITVNALGWTTVAIYGLLAIAYGYFQFGPLESS